jgi:hypothetical protein
MNLTTISEGLNKMQTIALTCIGLAALNGTVLMSTLWYMASTGNRPGWLPRSLAETPQAANLSQL